MVNQTSVASEPRPTLSFPISLNVNGKYGASDAVNVYHALVDHRDTFLRLSFEALQQEEHRDAHMYFNDYEGLNQVINELVEGAIALADHNHWAADLLSRPGSHARDEESFQAQREERYQRWKKIYVGKLDTDSAEAEKQHGIYLSIYNDFKASGANSDVLAAIAKQFGIDWMPEVASTPAA